MSYDPEISKAMDTLWAAGYEIWKDGGKIVEPKMIMVDAGPSMYELFKKINEERRK